MENSAIEWTHHTFNPWIGCEKVHAGCDLCYAETLMDKRYGKVHWGPHGTRIRTNEAYWRKPLQWNAQAEREGKRFRVFCASLADVFEEWDGTVKNAGWDDRAVCDTCSKLSWIPKGTEYRQHRCPHCRGAVTPSVISDVRRELFALIDATPHLDWLLLTKRPQNIPWMWPDVSRDLRRANTSRPGCEDLCFRPNVWLGTSVSNQASADTQVPQLLKCRNLAPVLFLSIEPLLGPLSLGSNLPAERMLRWHEPMAGKVDWVIVGGESGHGARPMHPGWARVIRNDCEAAGTPFFFKQWGEWCPAVKDIDGEWDEDEWLSLSGAFVGMSRGTIASDAPMVRLGKKAAGRLLDGREHSEFPTPRIPAEPTSEAQSEEASC